jgi:NAD+ synthase
MAFTRDSVKLDAAQEADRLVAQLREDVTRNLKKRGAVVGISGGVDSSVVLALCVKALGPARVLGVMLPEKDSEPESLTLARQLARQYEVRYVVEEITGALWGFGCYRRRDEAVQRVFPEYDSTYKVKIGLPQNLLDSDSLNVFHATIVSPEGEEKRERLPLEEYLQIVAASNFKQRSRMAMLYYHAERLNYAVIGTGNKNEHDLGFFVKFGDGGADLKPIAHLFKTQVYQLAEHLDVPEAICARTPTTDTYSAAQTQEEFFFRLPFDILDTIWYGWEQGVPAEAIAAALNLKPEQVQNVINDIQRKTAATQYLRQQAV